VGTDGTFTNFHSSKNFAPGFPPHGGWHGLLTSPASSTQWVPRSCVFCKGGHDAADCEDFWVRPLCDAILERDLSPSHIHSHGTVFVEQIMPITAPSPLLRRLYPSTRESHPSKNEGWATRDGGGGGHLWGSSRGGENSLRRPECGWGCRGPSLWLFFALWAQRTILTQDDKTRRRAFDFGRGVAHL